MRKSEKVILILFIINSLALGYIILKPTEKSLNSNYSNKIDSLKSELLLIKTKRDSVNKRIDTTIVKIKQNERIYKETVNNIINNTVDDDYIFFINYLKENRERFDSINNSNTIKGN